MGSGALGVYLSKQNIAHSAMNNIHALMHVCTVVMSDQSLHKLFCKVLSHRLAPDLSKIVSCNQGAFLQNRSLHDNFELVNRTVKLIRQKRCSSFLIKLRHREAFRHGRLVGFAGHSPRQMFRA